MSHTNTLPQTPLNLLLSHLCESGGAEFQGLQLPFENLPALVLLTPLDCPANQKTTGALPLAELSTESVRVKVAELHARFTRPRNVSTTIKKFDTFDEAFSYCREVNAPVVVEVLGCRYKLYPSGTAKRISTENVRTKVAELRSRYSHGSVE